MAVVSGTVQQVRTIESGAWDPKWQCAEVLFTVSGTYAQADNGELALLPGLIEDSRRNGKTVTVHGVMAGRPATKASDNSAMTLGTVATSGSGASLKATFAINGANWSTEIADAAAVPEQNQPFSLIVAFTEA